jgi:hypothetical protein
MTNTDRDKQTNELLHKLWGVAKDAPGYVKDDWMKLQSLIQMTQESSNRPCDVCDERHRHEGEAQDGLTNAYEMAGLQ